MRKLWLLLPTLVLASAVSAQNLPFVVGDWEPYTGARLEGGGVAVALIEAACRAAGLAFDLDFAPWKRAEAMVLQGDAFASFPYLELAERGEGFLYSAPFLVTRFVVLARTAELAGQVDPGNPASFRGRRVGFTAGTDVLQTSLTQAGALVETTTTLEPSVRKLEFGRLDYVVDDQSVVEQALRSLYRGTPPAGFVRMPQPFGTPGLLRVMVSRVWPDSEALVRRLNQGLAQIRNDGTVARILKKWNLTPP